ncbi:hypothetical protein BK784_28020 [Bacillus thuringiensis serovar medellin]|uniref:Uncharacterized protein n=1 Tax=Bacillus thuringiensis subsp. medellin TaxID=79672 RepID=A0A9X6RBI9_BACTV|nr:hypothetical protein BK784_28020 [Bacillus thuringiensis serovar medellin]
MIVNVQKTGSFKPEFRGNYLFLILGFTIHAKQPKVLYYSQNEITVAGIEFIRSSDGTIYTYDINTNTNYNSDAESIANQFGMLELATFLGRELEKQVESVK